MPSPFPGMDPYVEGYLWPDVHHELASEIRTRLNEKIAPQYVARIVVRTIVQELETGDSVGIMIPDVQVYASRTSPYASPSGEGVATITPASATVIQPLFFEAEIPSIEIRDVAGGTLITSIKVLSPTNKRGTGWDEYEAKRVQVMQAQAHLLEIDLLRRGRRHVSIGTAPHAPYYVFLTRPQNRRQVELWATSLREPLPIIPVPLRPPDPDVPLDLQTAFSAVYDRARYDLSINYIVPPDPPLGDDDAAWAARLLNIKPAASSE